ncbi:hypothetical protein DUNSADRAFT_13341 [Dunaliella salina]|uniref:Guanylate cyclase domain-containing protein n=1 Tax=Dunaliella salina TaxID=3046 RepID=A0ABQ7G9L0_DUNSA|nr:hypothetical protein DUNSADRAFT_13341 [Dunaliella salina]|eukprot:KAF5831285.1 hypothetical protein DUNSADRAFT_13341 [Dunaliella salina]
MELWGRAPPTDIGTMMRHLLFTTVNLVLGTSACCLLCLAHNRRTTMPSSTSATAAAAAAAAGAAGAPAEGQFDIPATAAADTQAAANLWSTASTWTTANIRAFARTQSTVVPGGKAKCAAEQGHNSMFFPFSGLASLAFSRQSPCLGPSAQPALSGWTPLLVGLCYSASLLAWVQRGELWLLTAVSREEAQLLVSLTSAVFVGTRFLTSVANYIAPGSVAMSPSMDMLGILLGMMMGGSPDMYGWAAAQHRAYRCVRRLLQNIMPAHVADALEAYEAERELAYSTCTLGGSCSLTSTKSCLQSEFQRAYTSPASHLPSNNPSLENKRSLDSDCKLGLKRRHTFSERHEQVTLLFADIVEFTALSDQVHPSEVMILLSDLYHKYDRRAVELDLYTVDVVGDCYMCAANLVKPLPNHVNVMVEFARNIKDIANNTLSPLGTTLSTRVGIHTGPLMSGVLGVHRLKFTLLGDTVNVASRMETTAIPNTLQVSEQVYKELHYEQLARLPAATGQRGMGTDGCNSWDMDGPSWVGEQVIGCSMVKANSAPCLLPHMHHESGAGFEGPRCAVRSSFDNRGRHVLYGQKQLLEHQRGQGPAHLQNWLARELNVKGKGTMKAYTYTGP